MSPLTIQAARLVSRRALGASLQQHMFRRAASTTAPADIGRIVKTRAQTLLIFFPAMGLALGWPLLAKLVVDGSF